MNLLLYFRRFWSNLVFEPDYMATIVSFLQEAVPAYVSITSLTTNEEIIELYSKIARNVLTVLCRTVTNKESEVSIYPCTTKMYQKIITSYDIISIANRLNG